MNFDIEYAVILFLHNFQLRGQTTVAYMYINMFKTPF